MQPKETASCRRPRWRPYCGLQCPRPTISVFISETSVCGKARNQLARFSSDFGQHGLTFMVSVGLPTAKFVTSLCQCCTEYTTCITASLLQHVLTRTDHSNYAAVLPPISALESHLWQTCLGFCNWSDNERAVSVVGWHILRDIT